MLITNHWTTFEHCPSDSRLITTCLACISSHFVVFLSALQKASNAVRALRRAAVIYPLSVGLDRHENLEPPQVPTGRSALVPLAPYLIKTRPSRISSCILYRALPVSRQPKARSEARKQQNCYARHLHHRANSTQRSKTLSW